MIEKLIPIAFGLALLGLLASSFAIPVSKPAHPRQSCYRSFAGNGWVCEWAPSPRERCWRTNTESACSQLSATETPRGKKPEPAAVAD
jgi:hypothetical protein